MRLAIALPALCASMFLGGLLVGCVMGIPDASPPPARTEACQVWVRVDNGAWRCYEREKVLQELCKATACSP